MTDNKKKEKLKQTLFILVMNVKKATEHYCSGADTAERINDWSMNLDGEQDYAYKKIATLCESIRAEALKDLIEEEYGNDLITSIDYYNIGKLVLAKLFSWLYDWLESI